MDALLPPVIQLYGLLLQIGKISYILPKWMYVSLILFLLLPVPVNQTFMKLVDCSLSIDATFTNIVPLGKFFYQKKYLHALRYI